MTVLAGLIAYLAAIVGIGPAVALEPADRLTPPPAPATTEQVAELAPVGLTGCDEMRWYREAAGLPEVFDRLGYRESRCRNDVTSSTGCCVGYWQNYLSSHLSAQSAYRAPIVGLCGVTTRGQILGLTAEQKWAQACVTAVVYAISGLSPWSL